MVSLSALRNTCVPFPATAEYTTKSIATRTEPIRLFITTDSHYAGTFSKCNCFRTLKKKSVQSYLYSISKARSSTRCVPFRVQFVFRTPISFGVKYSFSNRINNGSPQTSSYTHPRNDLLRKVVKLCKYMRVFFFQTITLCHTYMINGDEQTNAFMST